MTHMEHHQRELESDVEDSENETSEDNNGTAPEDE